MTDGLQPSKVSRKDNCSILRSRVCTLPWAGDPGLEPQDIDYVNTHGTSTQINDRTETMAIKAVFGDHSYRLAARLRSGLPGVTPASPLARITATSARRRSHQS